MVIRIGEDLVEEDTLVGEEGVEHKLIDGILLRLSASNVKKKGTTQINVLKIINRMIMSL